MTSSKQMRMKSLGKSCSQQYDTPSEASLTCKAYLQADVHDNKNQEKLVCRDRADTEVYLGDSKPLNNLLMIDFQPVSFQTLCMHGVHCWRNPTRRHANTRIVDYYYGWKACDNTDRSLTCLGKLHIIYVEPIPTSQKHVAGSSCLCAGTDRC